MVEVVANAVHMGNTVLDQCRNLHVAIHVRVQMVLRHRPIVVPTALHLVTETGGHVTDTTIMATLEQLWALVLLMAHQKRINRVPLIRVGRALCHVLMVVAIRLVSLVGFMVLNVRVVHAGGGVADVVVHGASIVMDAL